MFRGVGSLIAITFVLVGCGGGYGISINGGGGGGGTTTNYAGQAQGVYSGTASSGYSFESIVLPNDKFYGIYGTVTGNSFSASGMVTGQGVSGNDTYTASVTDFENAGQIFTGSLSATDVPGSSVNGTFSENGQTISFNGMSLPTSSFNYNTPASLADISGSWTGSLLSGASTTVTINSNGNVNGSSSGCSFSGTVTADSSKKNFFDVSLTFGGSPCALPNQTASGIAVDYLLSDGITRQLLAGVTAGTSAGTVFFAQRTGNGTTPNALNGQYAFAIAGFDANGNAMGMAGSFKADGFGHITAGEVDLNDSATPAVVVNNTSLAGTYSFDATGDSTLGTIQLTNSITGLAHPLAFGFSLQASGNFGQIMSLDANDFIAAGTMQLQSSSVFTLSGMAGSYAATINGRNTTNPTSILGSFTLASTGSTSGNTFDRSIAGLGTAPSTGASAAATFASAGPDSNGRGTFTLTLNDGLVTTATQNFAYYAITKTRFVAVETDAGSPMTADFSGQQGTPFTASTVVTTGGVFGMAGIDTVASNEITAVGQLQMTGATATGGTLNWDSNDNGATHTGISLPGQAVTFDPTTGRGTVTVTGGHGSGLADTLVFYLTAPGAGFVLDATAGTNNRAMAGPMLAQAAGPYSASTDLAAGLAIVRSRGSSVNDALALVGLFGLTTDETTYELLADERDPSDITQPQLDTPFTGITLGAINGSVGRGTFSLPNGSSSSTFAFYIIGPNQFYFLDINPVDGASTVFFASPH